MFGNDAFSLWASKVDFRELALIHQVLSKSVWINPISGAMLLGGGVHTFLDSLFPVTMAM